MSTRNKNRAVRRAFTLLEMMLVVVIMGILATVVVVSFGGRSEAARIAATRSQLAQINSALQQYYGTHALYPATLAGLAQGAAKYLEKIPKDGWKHEFRYVYPTSSQDPEKPYELFSTGKDGAEGTADDINIWTMDANG